MARGKPTLIWTWKLYPGFPAEPPPLWQCCEILLFIISWLTTQSILRYNITYKRELFGRTEIALRWIFSLTDLWLVQTGHVTSIQASDWSRLVTWPQYRPLIGPDKMSRGEFHKWGQSGWCLQREPGFSWISEHLWPLLCYYYKIIL